MNKYIQKIKKLRLERGFSQDQIAKTIGVSRPTYTAIESGKQELSLEEAKKLATLFSIGVDELLSGSIPNIQKYKHMILTFLRMNVSRDGKIPKTKLAKLLYLSDFAWFYHSLESMSGMQYRKIVYGPVPDIFFRVLDELEEDGKIIIDRKFDDGKDIFLVSESESNKNEKIQTISSEEKDLMKIDTIEERIKILADNLSEDIILGSFSRKILSLMNISKVSRDELFKNNLESIIIDMNKIRFNR